MAFSSQEELVADWSLPGNEKQKDDVAKKLIGFCCVFHTYIRLRDGCKYQKIDKEKNHHVYHSTFNHIFFFFFC